MSAHSRHSHQPPAMRSMTVVLLSSMLLAFASTPYRQMPTPVAYADSTPVPDHWMADLAGRIAQRPLTQIVLPGSHDTGTYQYAAAEDLYPYAVTQGLDVTQQLAVGARVFDLRIKPDHADASDPARPTGLYIFHWIAPVTHLNILDVFTQLRDFVESPAHARELLVVQISTFLSEDQRKNDQTQILLDEACSTFLTTFGNHLVNRSLLSLNVEGPAATTVEDVWNMPGHPTVITAWPSCPSIYTSMNLDAAWLGSFYANQCYPQAYFDAGMVATDSGIIAAVASAIDGRRTAVETRSTDPIQQYGPTGLGTRADHMYNLGVQATESSGCLLGSPYALNTSGLGNPSNEDTTLEMLMGWYANNQHNVRRNLNILS